LKCSENNCDGIEYSEGVKTAFPFSMRKMPKCLQCPLFVMFTIKGKDSSNKKWRKMDSPMIQPDRFDPNGKCLPLFLGPGCEAVMMARFVSRVTPDSYSYFPIVVRSLQVPNRFFTLWNMNAADKTAIKEAVMQKMKLSSLICGSYEELEGENRYTVILTLKSFDALKIRQIIENILIPAGIGCFWSVNEDDLCPMRLSDAYLQPKAFMPSPYSITMVRQILFDHDPDRDEDLDPFSVFCLKFLHYPIPPVILPLPNLERRRDRFIFCEMMLRHPPFLREELEPSATIAIPNVTKDYWKIGTVRAYSWVWLYTGVDTESWSGKRMTAFLGDPEWAPIDLLADSLSSRFCISCAFSNGEAALMSPVEAELFIQFPSDVRDGYVDIYYEKDSLIVTQSCRK
jgi:hypothetical protein